MSGMIDLHDYDDVKDNAENIFSVLENGTMPADETRPWPQEWIDIFRRWINEGCAP